MAKERAAPLVRDAREDEIDRLADIWHAGWRDAHAAILPAELARLRTRESFALRLCDALDTVRVAGIPGRPIGFCMTRADELHQLFVSPEGRGKGIAAALEADAVALIARRGARFAWLACAIGNERAARFYEKAGWRLAGTVTSLLDTPEGVFPLDVWRYEKALGV